MAGEERYAVTTAVTNSTATSTARESPRKRITSARASTAARSVPIGLGIGILWAGPLENILGDRLAIGGEWFPGLLLRYVVAPETAVLTGAALVLRLVLYAVIALLLVGVLLRRRDVTS